MIRKIVFTLFMTAGLSCIADAPANYYSSCEGKSGKSLLQALHNKISSHTNVGYNGLWDVYADADIDSNGLIWDIYSTKRWPVNSQHCGNYSNVGDCYNREHTVPQSWFNEAQPMKSDAFHVYPTDGKVNGQRSNYPYGECANGTNLGTHNGVRALGRLGTSTTAGYSGKVFEPDDEYKGDIARTYFYMAACYNDRVSTWDGESFAGNNFPVFTTWTLNMLLRWHAADPVSDKERDRNEGVYAHQSNRNPFIDYPDLVDHIWGSLSDVGWSTGSAPAAVLAKPVNGSTEDFGIVAASSQTNRSITVAGTGFTESLTVSITGTGFTVSPTSLTASSVNGGTTVNVGFKATEAGDYNGNLTLKWSGGSTVVKLHAKIAAPETLTALNPTEVSSEGFTARWICSNSGATYRLHVTKNGSEIAGYPRNVNAGAESYAVTGLESDTWYEYRIEYNNVESNVISVKTFGLLPEIEMSSDVPLEFLGAPGVPTNPTTIYLYTANLDIEDLEVEVKAPFEVSTDLETWGQRALLDIEDDHFYLRMNGNAEGFYETTIRLYDALYGDLLYDRLEAYGEISTAGIHVGDVAPRGWEAVNRGGKLTVINTLARPLRIGVYNLYAQALYEGLVGQGSTSLELPAGVYIITDGETSRKVVIR